MGKPLRVLIIEDSEDDTLLLLHELKSGGYDPEYLRVETPEAVRKTVSEEHWDIVLSDYRMPLFDGLDALSILKESGLDIPFILISGQIGEDVAVEAMKAGAHDFITKGKMARLMPAIERELSEAKERSSRRRAEEELENYRSQLERMVQERTSELSAANTRLRREITERKQMEEIIKHQAHHDALTGLPNRRLFMDILSIELALAKRSRKRFAVLFLDLDRFKYINDTLGHDIGDELLKQVAARFKGTIRQSDIVARIGGDEFNILLNDVPHSEDISIIADKIVNSFKKSFSIRSHELYIQTSIGISIYPDDGTDIERLFKSADIAMYNAKEQGGNTYQFYNSSMNIRTIERLRMENWLRQSLDRGELMVYYQPQLLVETGEVLCAEALVRWRHPGRGILEPKDFIPLAEETGFITAIDEWVLKTACRQFAEWQKSGFPGICVTVNISAKQFQQADLAEKISQILEDTGFDPQRLDLEITESTAMRNMEHTIPNMNRLAKMGIGIAIDDFGTGYSSLNYLKKLPIHKLKIDKSFVKDIATDPDDRIIISAVTAMAQNMKLRVIAEGVETKEQMEFLKSIGCREMQGFLFSKPLPSEEFRELIAAGKN